MEDETIPEPVIVEGKTEYGEVYTEVHLQPEEL